MTSSAIYLCCLLLLVLYQPPVYPHIAFCHSTSGKPLFEYLPATFAAELRNPPYCCNRIFQLRHDEASATFFHQFRNRSLTVSNYWSATGHRLYHDQPERLRPINRKQQGIGIAQKFVLLPFTDLANAFHKRFAKQRLHNCREVILIHA